MANMAQFIETPRSAAATISTANTARDGSGAMAIVFTAGALGARLERVVVSATGTTAAGSVALFIGNDNSANTTANTNLYAEVAVTAVTPSETVAAFTGSVSESNDSEKWPLILGPGQTLRASTTVAQSFRVVAVGGDY